MSSTNRGSERNKFDYYVTPDWLVDEFLDKFLQDYPLPKDALILDCCAGGCPINHMPYPVALEKRGYNVISMDIRDDSRAMIIGDYLTTPKIMHYDLIITNPSFDLSTEITSKAISEAKTVVMLQRLNWVGSDRRAPFWTTNNPVHLYAHNKRASFTSDGKKDSIEYGHFVFREGHTGTGKFDLII